MIIYYGILFYKLNFTYCYVEAFDGRRDNELDCLWQFEYVPASKWNVKEVAAFVRYCICSVTVKQYAA